MAYIGMACVAVAYTITYLVIAYVVVACELCPSVNAMVLSLVCHHRDFEFAGHRERHGMGQGRDRRKVTYSYGLYGYGLCSCALYSYGLRSYGLDNDEAITIQLWPM